MASGIYESGNTESESKSPIPNWKNIPIGDSEYPFADILPNWVISSISDWILKVPVFRETLIIFLQTRKQKQTKKT